MKDNTSDVEASSRQNPFVKAVGRLMGKRGDGDLRERIEEYLDETVLDEQELALGGNERAMLANVLKLRELTAEDVAIPRADIGAVDIDASFADLMNEVNQHRHSRLPVYKGTLDEVLGFVHIKDLLPYVDRQNEFSLKDHLRQPSFVSPAMQISDLLLKMRETRIHLALVVDEYGGVDGLITIEDLVEQIVGEIEDEHDDQTADPAIRRVNDHWVADARLPIDEFESVVGQVLTSDDREADVDTLGGLIFALSGRVPSRGEVLIHDSGFEFKVSDADMRRVKKLIVRAPASTAA